MTGSFVVRGVAAPVYKSFAVDDSAWPPRFTKLHLELSGGGAVAFADARRFARIRLQHDPAAEAPVSDLGWDALTEAPSAEAFAAALAKRGAPIKAVLLDQSFAAGVGNWVADEVRPACRCLTAAHALFRASTYNTLAFLMLRAAMPILVLVPGAHSSGGAGQGAGAAACRGAPGCADACLRHRRRRRRRLGAIPGGLAVFEALGQKNRHHGVWLAAAVHHCRRANQLLCARAAAQNGRRRRSGGGRRGCCAQGCAQEARQSSGRGG